MGKVGYLSTLHEKYYDKGLRVVAISDESIELLREEMLEKREAKYWIGSDPANETLEGFTDGGPIGIPRFYLIDGKGQVVANDFPSDEELEEVLRSLFDPALGRELHAELAKARLNYERGAYGRAFVQAGELLEGGEDARGADAAFLRGKLESLAAHRLEWLDSDLDPRKPNPSYGELLELELRFEGLPISTTAAARRKELEAESDVKRDEKAWKAFRTALERDLATDGLRAKLVVARQYYERVVEKQGFSEAGRRAAEAVARLSKELGEEG